MAMWERLWLSVAALPAMATGARHWLLALCSRSRYSSPNSCDIGDGHMRLQGKVCVVTAAGQGIGAATALAFAARARRSGRPTSTPKLLGAGRRRGRSAPASSTCSTRRPSAPWPATGRGRRAVQLRGLRPSRRGARRHRRAVGASPSTSMSARCSGRSRPSCRACWTRAADHRQHVVGRLVGEGRAASLHLRHDQGGRDRPDQVGRGRLTSQAASAATRSAPAP